MFQSLNDITNHGLSIDWKCPIDDAVLAMKEVYPQWKDIFTSEIFTAFVENYDAEMGDTYLAALGQELSIYGLVLYCIYEDTDDYNLVLFEQKFVDEFEAVAKKEKLKFKQQKQSRKKWGTPATRINLAERIQCDIYHDDNYPYPLVFLNYPFAVRIEYEDERTENGRRDTLHSIMDFRVFPPKIHSSEKVTRLAYNNILDLWVALIRDEENAILKIGKNVFNISEWNTINISDRFDDMSDVHWIEDDILVAYKKNVWIIKSVTTDKPTCQKILEADSIGQFAHSLKLVKTLSGNFYLLGYHSTYRYNGRKFIALKVKPNSSNHHFCPSGKNRVCYIEEGILYEINLVNNKIRNRPIPQVDKYKSSISHFTDDWAIVTSFGEPSKDKDIAAFWNISTDIWYRIKLGALGKYGIADAVLTSDGNVIFDSHFVFFRVTDIMNKIKTFEPIQLDAWNETWEDERDEKTPFIKKSCPFLANNIFFIQLTNP